MYRADKSSYWPGLMMVPNPTTSEQLWHSLFIAKLTDIIISRDAEGHGEEKDTGKGRWKPDKMTSHRYFRFLLEFWGWQSTSPATDGLSVSARRLKTPLLSPHQAMIIPQVGRTPTHRAEWVGYTIYWCTHTLSPTSLASLSFQQRRGDSSGANKGAQFYLFLAILCR